MSRSDRSRLFAIVAVVCVTAAVAYTALAVARTPARSDPGAVTAPVDVSGGAQLLFLNTQGDSYRPVALASLGDLDAPAIVTGLQCQRIHVAGGRGICAGRGLLGGAAIVDAQLRPVRDLQMTGLASRARVSADGRYGSITAFVRGDSYADAGFSTRATIVDMAAGTTLAELEQFALTALDGRAVRSIDRNFWGVTFMPDSDRFYATVGTAGKTYLVEGRVSERTVRMIRENVECPSLSPDGSRLVYKKRLPGTLGMAVAWRLHLLDLATMTERPLAEGRSVDDQIEWLDDRRIVYSIPDAGPPATIRPDLWLLEVDGGAPRLVRTEAMSPAALRGR